MLVRFCTFVSLSLNAVLFFGMVGGLWALVSFQPPEAGARPHARVSVPSLLGAVPRAHLQAPYPFDDVRERCELTAEVQEHRGGLLGLEGHGAEIQHIKRYATSILRF